ncbi:MAG: FkbM family methyltransferase, partial [Siculibacillus sp.]|nr:FkbM family methyltransferase [Siculibacillus sp.]
MSKLGDAIIAALEKLSGRRIIEPGFVGLVFEEEHLRRFFERFRVDCVFDVGANAGQYVDMLRSRVGYRGPVVSFEPIPELAAKLRERARGASNWFIEEAALDAEVRVTSFNVMAADQFSSLCEPSHRDVDEFRHLNVPVRRIELTTSTLATHVRAHAERLGFTRPFLKLDTQGRDTAIVAGAGEEIHRFVGLQSELAVRRLYDDTPDFAEALAYYRSLGFVASAFVPNNAGHFP